MKCEKVKTNHGESISGEEWRSGCVVVDREDEAGDVILIHHRHFHEWRDDDASNLETVTSSLSF